MVRRSLAVLLLAFVAFASVAALPFDKPCRCGPTCPMKRLSSCAHHTSGQSIAVQSPNILAIFAFEPVSQAVAPQFAAEAFATLFARVASRSTRPELPPPRS